MRVAQVWSALLAHSMQVPEILSMSHNLAVKLRYEVAKDWTLRYNDLLHCGCRWTFGVFMLIIIQSFRSTWSDLHRDFRSMERRSSGEETRTGQEFDNDMCVQTQWQ